MPTYAVDFESYYDDECSITTLGPRGYFSHPSFDAYMVTVVGDDGYVYAGNPRDFDWSILNGNVVLSHNASFDESLDLYGVEQGWFDPCSPAAWHCTADMAAFLGLPRALKNASATVFGLSVDKTVRDNMKGKRWESMSEEFRKEVTDYAIKDSELCLRLWQELSHKWPEHERAISALNRKIGQRGLPMDTALLQRNLERIKTALFEAEQEIPWTKEATPLSRKAFNAQCRAQGITPPASLAQDNEEADAWFAAHQQACPWARAVQNYRRINAFMRKLESFAAGTMADGRYYGGIMYFGSTTGRFSGSGGNANLQNLPREEMFGVNFRSMIRPAAGRKLVVLDLSQIEVRTLCWLAQDTTALNLIRESEDIYHAFGVLLGLHDPANGQLKEYDKALRHKVKSIVLGCFEPDTLVLTQTGWKPILNLGPRDLVWDGVEWVEHQGVVCQGIQETMRVNGVGATPDHETLTEHGWREWSEVHTYPSLLKSALASAPLPCWSGSITKEDGIQECGATADGLVLWTDTMPPAGNPPDATAAPNSDPLPQTGTEAATKASYPEGPTENDSSIESQPASSGATTRKPKTSTTTVVGGSLSSNLGGETGKNSSPTCLDSTVGVIQPSSSTGSTTTEDTSRATSDSSIPPATCETAAVSEICSGESSNSKRRSLVYDVSHAGPRNRFTILTDSGPMIVHNCGYGMGAARFSGFSGMSLPEAEEAVRIYRERMRKVVDLWGDYTQAMTMSHSLGEPFTIEFPSGRTLNYGRLKRMRDMNGRFRFIGKVVRFGQLRDFPLYGGIACENASQGLARDVFSDMMLRIDAAGHEIILHVHDEVVIECAEADAEKVLAECLEIMSTPPAWIPDIPLSAEGQILDFYCK
jgi:DNA polymerase I-like protein with 3'-5' exonuclease and polymerase domains